MTNSATSDAPTFAEQGGGAGDDVDDNDNNGGGSVVLPPSLSSSSSSSSPACRLHFRAALPGGGWTDGIKFKRLYFYHVRKAGVRLPLRV